MAANEILVWKVARREGGMATAAVVADPIAGQDAVTFPHAEKLAATISFSHGSLAQLQWIVKNTCKVALGASLYHGAVG